MTSNSWHLFSIIRQEDQNIPFDILELANDIFNKLNGLKTVKNDFCKYTRYELATNHQIKQVDKYNNKFEAKIDVVGCDITRLMLQLINHYKDKPNN